MTNNKKIPVEVPTNKKAIDSIPSHDGSVDDIPVINKELIRSKDSKLRKLIRSEIARLFKQRGIKIVNEYIGISTDVVGINGEIFISESDGGNNVAIALRKTDDTNPLQYIEFSKDSAKRIASQINNLLGE